MRRLNDVGADENGSSNHVPELSDVAGPGIPTEELERFVGDPEHRASELVPRLDQEPLGQVRNILRPVPQRRQNDHELGQPVIEILAEMPGPDIVDERGTAGGKDSYVKVGRASSSQTLHSPVIQDPQEFCLGRVAQHRDFVEEERSSLRELKVSVLSPDRAGEHAFLVTEELRLHEGSGSCPAVQGHERLVTSGTHVMDRARDELLARAGLSLDENPERGVGNFPDLLDDALDPSARSHEPSKRTVLTELITGRFDVRRSRALISWSAAPHTATPVLSRRSASRVDLPRHRPRA